MHLNLYILVTWVKKNLFQHFFTSVLNILWRSDLVLHIIGLTKWSTSVNLLHPCPTSVCVFVYLFVRLSRVSLRNHVPKISVIVASNIKSEGVGFFLSKLRYWVSRQKVPKMKFSCFIRNHCLKFFRFLARTYISIRT